MMKNEYSGMELKLIRHFGFGEIYKNISPASLYALMVTDAFLSEEDSNYTDALRKCVKSFQEVSGYRMTLKWDEMIRYELEKTA